METINVLGAILVTIVIAILVAFVAFRLKYHTDPNLRAKSRHQRIIELPDLGDTVHLSEGGKILAPGTKAFRTADGYYQKVD